MNPWVRIGRLVRARGKQGDLEVVATSGLPFLFAEGEEIHLVPPDIDISRKGTITSVVMSEARRGIIHLDSVNTWEEALALEGKYCLTLRESLEHAEMTGLEEDYAGFIVFDEVAGEIGRFDSFIENPAQRLAVVSREDGSEVLIPWVDELITSVDEEAGVLTVSLPAGLLDL